MIIHIEAIPELFVYYKLYVCFDVECDIESVLHLHIHSFQQMQWRLVMPILVLALGQFTWMVLAALAVRTISLTALGALLSAVLVVTQKMQEYDVKVCSNNVKKNKSVQ